MPRKALHVPENLPKQTSRQVTFGQLYAGISRLAQILADDHGSRIVAGRSLDSSAGTEPGIRWVTTSVPGHARRDAAEVVGLVWPDYRDPVAIHPDEFPVFWACGVTPQAVALQARPELMITPEPGIMFLTDLPRGDIRS